jgi:hypothetical protein
MATQLGDILVENELISKKTWSGHWSVSGVRGKRLGRCWKRWGLSPSRN